MSEAALDWVMVALFVVAIVAHMVENERLRRDRERWLETAALWRSLRTMERAAEREQSAWACGEVERLKTELIERGQAP